MSSGSLHHAAVDADSLRARIERASAAAAESFTDALLISPGADLRYLLGQAGGSYERLTTLIVPSGDTAPSLVVPKLEAPAYADVPADDLGIDVLTWRDGEDPYQLVADLVRIAAEPGRIAVSDTMTALHVLGLRAAIPAAEQVLAGPVLRQLRMRKDAAEIEALREAAAAIDRVHARVPEFLRAGRTEAEVAADLEAAIVEEGHTSAEFIIVGSGPNGASPHHEVSQRVIERGDMVVVDIGGPTPAGYYSDCTRTYAVGQPRDPDARSVYSVLQRAQEAAVAAVGPGIAAQDVDAAARDPITEAGYGDHFIHRTGHGIGLDVHEEPYLMAGNELVLEPGAAFSVEPGIYLPGRWGARIEDIVLVTSDGVETLNNRPRELMVVDE
ncbi:Xaa-Pro peptidase family protein [Haloechinothrix sp. LS1_15]|uniref:M24 family metallopeptidase n=1 Tax=Haloechinothrix sp. LS1_15 TaxID=2652248 RepID=UPI002948893E|nr:Xaa-Pro peptidase family protein [Haloechinothrix sp. LS1_15]MDV6014003.1 aminopeptidase P family protein [Haloechinothrix sp. LS1_15]